MAALGLVVLLAAGSAAAPATAGTGSAGGIGVTVIGNPLSVSLALGKAKVPVGESVIAVEGVRNTGPTQLSAVTYRLLLASAAFRVSGPIGAPGVIAGFRSGLAAFTICPLVAGSYLIQAIATARNAAGIQFTVVSPARLLVVEGGGRARCR